MSKFLDLKILAKTGVAHPLEICPLKTMTFLTVAHTTIPLPKIPYLKTFTLEIVEAVARKCSFLKKWQASGMQLYEKRIQQRCFPVNFPRILRTPFI